MDSRLGLHSAYSLLYGVRQPEDLMDRALQYGAKTVAVSDINGMYGLHKIQQAALERGLKSLCSVKFVSEKGPVFAFAAERPGYIRLCELLSRFSKDNRNPALRIISAADLTAELRTDSRGLILAAYSSELLKSLAGHCARLYAAISPVNLSAVTLARTC